MLKLGFPIFSQDIASGEEIAIEQLQFSASVRCGKSGAIQAAGDWVQQAQTFIRVYAAPLMENPIPLTNTLTEQIDATDVLQIFTEMMPISRESRTGASG